MSYQVLARKWRPKSFSEMVGQQHVLQAIINALDEQRLHHAYLFTGTRGVGKTTIARIFAKSLNCETNGISSTPCGECPACVAINEGRFVDLLEVDAASRTKVEDTREILENVQYAPTAGRFKVYLIDEVHMLSTHSFNALLKTLEEPPAHVKFLLATTDPQKLPVTILSRCLQFNLKRMPLAAISGHLAFVLGEEKIEFDQAALEILAIAADGSMRDALSLLDQSIAFGAGVVREAAVAEMLSSINPSHLWDVLNALGADDGDAIMAAISVLAEHSADYANVLSELMRLCHQLVVAHQVPQALSDERGEKDKLIGLAELISAEDAQLYYQIAAIGRRDLALAPDGRMGLEMCCLRMLAFKPAGSSAQKKKPLN